MKIRIILQCLVFVFVVSSLYAQEKTSFVEIEGRVQNSIDKKTIEGVVVAANGAKEIAITDTAGYFKILVPEKDANLSFSSLDFYHKEVRVRKGKKVNIYLLPRYITTYNDVIKLPFKNVSAEDYVGTSKNLQGRSFDRGRVFVDELLVGNVAGLRNIQKSGTPGEGNFMSIRGSRSLTASNTPILVIDGMPILSSTNLSSVFTAYSRNAFNTVSLREIDDLSVIRGKDAIPYGSIGSNGVVFVNTDRALDMETSVEFETTNGISFLAKELPLLSGSEFRGYLTQIGLTSYTQTELEQNFPFLTRTPEHGSNYYTYAHNTNWQKEVFTPAVSTENTLRVKGGDSRVKYSLLAGYMKDKGIVTNTFSDRYFARINGDMQMNRQISMFANIGFNYFNNKLTEQGLVPEINPMLAAILKPSILGPKRVDKHGNEMESWEPVRDFGISNPTVLTNEVDGESSLYNTMINFGLNYQIASFLSFKGLFGINHEHAKEKIFIPGVTLESIAYQEDGRAKNMIREGVDKSMSYYGNFSLSLDHEFEKGHYLNSVLGGQLLVRDHIYEFQKGINTATDYNNQLTDVKDPAGKHISGNDEPWRWANYFMNVDYNYNRQWYLGLAVSVDASSVSGEKSDMFQIYPSVNFAWDVSNSSFLNNSELIDRLVVRAEYLHKGNSMYSSKLSKYHYTTNEFLTLGGVIRSGVPNPELKPEYIESVNLGLDFAVIGNKVNVSFDLYEDKTKDMIVTENMESAYGSEFRYVNEGEMINRGIEFGINAILIKNADFSWDISATIAHEKMEIVSLGENVNQRITTLENGAQIITKVGESPYLFYGLKSLGVYQNTADALHDAYTNINGREFRGGDLRYLNNNSLDNVIDGNDKVIIGDPNPDFYGGISTSFTYKRIRLSALFSYSYGNDIYNAIRQVGEGMTDFSGQMRSVKNAWAYEGHQTDMPRADYGDPMRNSQFSSRWIEDGSYIKLKNLTLNYEYPKKVWIFTDLQAYLVGENLFTLTNYLGYDPEFAYSYNPAELGVDYGKVPGARTFKIGLRLGF